MMTGTWSMRLWLTLILVVLSSIFFYESLSLSSVAGRIPLFVISTTLILLVIQLLIDLKLTTKSAATSHKMDESVMDEKVIDDAGTSERWLQRKRFGYSVFWIALLCGLVWLLGLVIGPCLFSLVWLRFSKHEPWIVSVTYSVALALIVSTVFTLLLRVVLFRGMLGELLFW